MSDKDKITTLTNNVANLLRLCEQLRAQNQQLAARLNAEKALTLQLNDHIRNLEQQLTVLTLVKATTEVSGTTKNAKARLNAMIKNIDKAIAILNK